MEIFLPREGGSMSIIFCLFAFLLINFLGMFYLFSKKEWPLSNTKEGSCKESASGQEKFILLSLLCAPVAAAPLGGMLALRLALWIVFCLIGIFLIRQKQKSSVSSPVLFFYSIYLIWLAYGLFYTSDIWMGARVFMKYLFPCLMMLMAQKFVTKPQVFWQGCRNAWKSLTIVILAYYFFFLTESDLIGYFVGGMFYFVAGIIDSTCVLLLVSYLLWRHERNPLFILSSTIALFTPVVFRIRTGIVGITICIAAALTFKYKEKALIFLLFPFILGAVLMLKVPQLREKMFYNPSKFENMSIMDVADRVSWEDINSSGRFFMWERLLKTFYSPSPLCGSGLGSTQALLYREHEKQGGLSVAHSDYVQILCDSGLIGLILYMISVLFFWLDCMSLYRNPARSKECRWAALIAGATLAGLAAAMMTDNAVNYSMTTFLFPFTFYGIAKGLEQHELQRNHTPLQ